MVDGFQSPSLRGSGRFPPKGGGRSVCISAVSIPFIAGQWSLLAFLEANGYRINVSIPFIAGQWSLPGRGGRRRGGITRFNPLHCGAVVASRRTRAARGGSGKFQSPSLRGSGRFKAAADAEALVARVSIPFIAGQWSLLPRTTPSSLFGVLLRKRRLPCDHIICTRLPF